MFNILHHFFFGLPENEKSLKDGTHVIQNGDKSYTVEVANNGEMATLPLQLDHAVADRLARLIEAAQKKEMGMFWAS